MKAAGSGLTQVGIGNRIIPGDGLHFITVAGSLTPITDGYGFRIANGVRDGLPGEDPKVITVGHP